MKTIAMVVFLFMTAHIAAQDFAGLATYKTDMKMEIKLDSANTSADQMDLMQQQLRLAMQKEFQLSFTKSESNWKEQQSLDKPTSGMDGVQIQVVGMGGGSDGLLYKNTKEKHSKESTDAFGKLFLISGALEPYEWEMTSETKQIGTYTCYKALAKREVTRTTMEEVNGEMSEKEEKIQQTTTAWYTPEIPVTHGPDMYWGLPGLILEVSDGSRMMICTQVVLNPEKGVTIEIPSKGKKVTEAEYEEIMTEQSKKMRKMYGGGKKKGKHGSSFSISIEN